MKKAAEKAAAMAERDTNTYCGLVAKITRGWAAAENLEFLGPYKLLITDASFKGQSTDPKQGYGCVQVEAGGERIVFGRTELGDGSTQSEYTGTWKSLMGVQGRWAGKDVIVANDNKRVIDVLAGRSEPTKKEKAVVDEIRQVMNSFNAVHFLKSTEELSAVSDHLAKYGIRTPLDLGAEETCDLENACESVFKNQAEMQQYGRSVNKYRAALTEWRKLIEEGLASETKNKNVGLLGLLSNTIDKAVTNTTVKKQLKRKGTPELREEESSNQRLSKRIGTASADASDADSDDETKDANETKDADETKDANESADKDDGDAPT